MSVLIFFFLLPPQSFLVEQSVAIIPKRISKMAKSLVVFFIEMNLHIKGTENISD